MGEFPIEAWSDFFVAEVGGAAALAGLVFVAISINLSKILAVEGLTGRAAKALMMLVGVVVGCSFGLVPHQGMPAHGVEYLVLGMGLWCLTVFGQGRSLREWARVAGLRIGVSVVLGQAATVPWIVAGVLLLTGHPEGLYWMAAGTICAIVAGVSDAWVLLVEIQR